MASPSLFDDAMKGRWNKVVEAYGMSGEANCKEARITKAGDTALHVAVSHGLTKTVQSMVNAIKDGDEAKRVLSIGNERGNTALHLAAQRGDRDMCESMVEKHKELVSACNKENETPIFCAARHGNMSVFLYLSHQGSDTDSLCRNKKLGDTILHAAISGEYIDLALQIINDHPELANSVNEKGHSPLHMLASKPNMFKSSYRFLLVDYLIYPCILIDPPIIHNHENWAQKSGNEETQNHPQRYKPRNEETGQNYPQNYVTCMNFFQILTILFEMFRDIPRDLLAMCKKTKRGDQENPQTKNKIDSYDQEEDISRESMCKMEQTKKDYQKKSQTNNNIQGWLPPNYGMIIQYFKFIMKALLIILGIGISRTQKLVEVKRRHTWTILLMDKLVERASSYKYNDNGRQPQQFTEAFNRFISATKQPDEDQDGQATIGVPHPEEVPFVDGNKTKAKVEDTAFLIAAKKGVVELVAKILDVFPVAIEDLDCNEKNAVLLAVENRQPCVYKLLLDREIMKEVAFRQVDVHGNSALHLAAMAGGHRPWLIPGAALQMQWELKWFKFVRNSMPPHTFAIYNNEGQSPQEVFKDTHQDLITKGTEWLTKTSESFSVVAALIATVAFSTSANIPGGVKEDSGSPNLKNQPAFNVFSIASVIALCFSVTALVFFLAILTSRFQEKNFARDLPRKLLVGLTALFTSVASILVSFCAGHFYLLGDHVRSAAYPIYAVTCFPVTFFVLAQLPLYFDLIVAIVSRVPQPSHQYSPC